VGGRLLAGTPSVRPSNTVKSVAVAVTGRGSRKNTVGQAWGSRRGEWDGHLRETHPGPRRHTRDTQGRMGPCGHRAMRTQKRIRGGGGGYKGQRNGDGQARSRDSPGGLLPHNTQALGLQGRMSRGGRRQLAAVPHGARRWAPEQGPAGGGGARGLGLNFALWVSVVDVAADSSSVHPLGSEEYSIAGLVAVGLAIVLRVPAWSEGLPTALTAQARAVPVLAQGGHLLGWGGERR